VQEDEPITEGILLHQSPIGSGEHPVKQILPKFVLQFLA
jgi:hypothetical protein